MILFILVTYWLDPLKFNDDPELKQHFAFWALFSVYAIWSWWTLDKYPTFYGDEALYSEPGYEWLTRPHKLKMQFPSPRTYPPVGFFETNNTVHGRLFTIALAASFKLFGVSVRAARLPSYLAGLGTIVLTYLVAEQIFKRKENR